MSILLLYIYTLLTYTFDMFNFFSVTVFALNRIFTNLVFLCLIIATVTNLPSLIISSTVLFFFVNLYKNFIVNIKFNSPLILVKYHSIVFDLLDGLIQLHPPMFYISVITLINFIFSKKLQTTKLTSTQNTYALHLLLLFSLFSGGYWSNKHLLWGNWWTWDGIELILLLFILLFYAVIHNQTKSYLRNFILFSGLLITIFYFFIFVRLGLVKSRHNFFNFTPNLSILFIVLVLTIMYSSILFTVNVLAYIYYVKKIWFYKLTLYWIFFIFSFVLLTIIYFITNLHFFIYLLLLFCVATFTSSLCNLTIKTKIIFWHFFFALLGFFLFFYKNVVLVVYYSSYYLYNLFNFSLLYRLGVYSTAQFSTAIIQIIKTKVYFEYGSGVTSFADCFFCPHLEFYGTDRELNNLFFYKTSNQNTSSNTVLIFKNKINYLHIDSYPNQSALYTGVISVYIGVALFCSVLMYIY